MATRSKLDVARFHADFDTHRDDRIRLFRAVAEFVSPATVLYPGSYVDIAPSVFSDDVHYVDTDRRAARFFDQEADVRRLIEDKRTGTGPATTDFAVRFDHADYQGELPIEDGSVDLLISLYAGFISESCSRYLAAGGVLLVNNSHGDASMASLDSSYELVAVVTSRDGRYRVMTEGLDGYLVTKNGIAPTVEGLHASGRGVGYTKSPFAYLFRRQGGRTLG